MSVESRKPLFGLSAIWSVIPRLLPQGIKFSAESHLNHGLRYVRGELTQIVLLCPPLRELVRELVAFVPRVGLNPLEVYLVQLAHAVQLSLSTQYEF